MTVILLQVTVVHKIVRFIFKRYNLACFNKIATRF